MIGPDTRALVTGGAGFIGSHLVEKLLARGAPVTVVDNLSTGRREHLQKILTRIELLVGDVGELLSLNQISLPSYSHIFHLAGNAYIPPSIENPAFDFQANAYNTFLLLDQLRQLSDAPRLVNVSSAAVYGDPTTTLPIRETDTLAPISPYGVSKLAGERYAAVYSRLYGVRATSLRFFSVYGPRQRKQVVYDTLCKLRANPRRLELLGDGSQARDFTYVGDVVAAMLLVAVRAPGHGEVYNVASGTTHSIAELVEVWCQVLGLTPEIVYSGHVRPGDAERWVVDITRLRELGFVPQFSLQDGLRAVRDWYDAEHAMSGDKSLIQRVARYDAAV